MDLFTYLMAKNGHNTSIHEDLFSYLLGKAQGGGGEIKTATGITINIPDAKAKRIANFMMTKESTQATSILPSEYTQVDYIESSGTQYINTGIKGQNGIKLEMDFMLNEMPSANTPMTGSYNTANLQRCYLGLVKPDGILGMSYITSTFSTTSIQIAKKYNLFVDFTKGNQNLKLDGTSILTGDNNTDLVQTKNVLLFGYDAGNGYDDRFPIKMKMYKSKLYIGNTLVRDFIPCYRNSDNEVGLYDLVDNVFYTNQGTGAFIYGSVAQLPNPDYPQEVKTVEGYRNLFDKDNFDRYYKTYINVSNNTWNLTTGSTNTMCLKFPCKSNTTYRIKIQDSNDTFLCRLGTTSSESSPVANNPVSLNNTLEYTNRTELSIIYSTNSDAKYIVIQLNYSLFDSLISKLIITEGDQELPYVPYGNNYIYTKVVGKNLFDKNNANVLNAYIDTNGNILSATNGKSLYINCKSNTTYTVSRISGTRFRIVDTNVLPEIGIKGNNFVGVDTSTSLTITTSNNAKYLCVNYFNRNTDGDTEQEILDSIQIEEGTTATEYEAYKETTTTIPLNNNEIVGIGDYKDELKVDKSGHCWLNKLTGKKVFDGTETFDFQFINAWRTTIENIKIISSTYFISNLLSNYFKSYTQTDLSQLSGSGISMRANQSQIIIKNLNVSSSTELKNWISNMYNTNPLIVYYVLETPELIDLQTTVDLKLFKGVNNVSNSEDGYMTIEYVSENEEA